MRILRAPKQKRISDVVFSPDSRGLLAQGDSAAVCWPSLNDGNRPLVYSAGAVWGIGYVTGTDQIVVSKGNEGVWTYPVVGGAGCQCGMPTERIQKFISSPMEPLVVLYQLMIYETPGALCCFRISEEGIWERVWTKEPNRGVTPYFSPDGKQIWQLIYQGMLCYDSPTGEVVEHIPAPPGMSRAVSPSAVSPDQKVVAKCIGRDLWIYNGDEEATIAIKNDGKKSFTAAAFHPSGRYLLVASNDGNVKLVDTSTWHVTASYDWKCGPIRCVAFSPDGLLAAAGSESTKIVVWDFDF